MYYKEQFHDTANFTSNHFKAINSAHFMLKIDPPRVNAHSNIYTNTLPLDFMNMSRLSCYNLAESHR